MECLAQSATADQFAELDEHLAAERRAIEAGNGAVRNRSGMFHVKIAEFAGNEVLAQILTRLVSRSSLVTLWFQSNRSRALLDR